jgi:hypothetical protein
MRIITVKRGYSKQILFSYEREAIDRIPLYRPIAIKRKDGKGSRVVIRQNPYLANFLRARYAIYKSLLVPTTINGREVTRIDVDAYAEAVRLWYRSHNYLDLKGTISPWAAIRDYEDSARHADPDNEWFNYPDELKKKGKSHHPTTERGRQMERERRKEYRQKKNIIH